MFNVAFKFTVAFTTMLTITAISCNNGNKEAATMLFESAKALYDSQQYDSTLSMLDTLNKRYPAETEIIRQGMHLGALTEEKVSLIGIAQADSAIAVNAPIVESIVKDFVVIKDPDLVENYRIYKSLKNNQLLNQTTFEPRVDDNGFIYLVSLLHGKAINHTKLRVIAPDGSSAETASIPFDNAQNYRFNNDGISNEMVTFHADQCDDFCRFIVDNIDKQLKLEFVGKTSYCIALPTNLKEAVAWSYKYSVAIQSGLKAEREKIYWNKRLEIAKRQIEQTKL